MDTGQGRPSTLDAATVAALCAGVLAALLSPTLPPRWAALLAVGAMATFATFAMSGSLAARQPLLHLAARPVPRLIAAFVLGVVLCTLHGHAAMSARLPIVLHDAGVLAEVRIVGLPDDTVSGSRAIVLVERVLRGPQGAHAALEGRRLALRWHGGGRALRPGELWRLDLRVAVVGRALGPGLADPGRRALLDRVAGEARVQAGSRPLRLGPAGGIDALRDDISAAIDAAIGPSRGRFVAALAVGDTRGLDDADWERLRAFGLTHLIAISGFHVGLVAGFGALGVRVAWWLWPRLALRWRRPQAASVGAAATALGYAALAGFSLPTVRTVLMIAVVCAIVLRRARSSRGQPLLLAIALIAVVDPLALLTPGFWLSCGGVAWLLWCLPGAQDAFDVRSFLKAQWVATLGLLPIAAGFFLQVPVLGPLANLVAIPWISLVVVPLALLGTLLSPLSDAASALAWHAAAGAVEALWSGLGALPPSLASSLWLPEASTLAVALAVLGVAIALLPRGWALRHAGWLLVLPLLAPRGAGPPPGEVELIVLPMPRGDAVLVRDKRSTVLVDAGPAGSGLVPLLRAVGVGRIDMRIETRGNAGRRGGAAEVDAAFPPREVWRAPADTMAGSRCVAGRRWQGAGFVLDAFGPSPELASTAPEDACVLRLRANGREIWLVSDAGRWAARRIAGEVRFSPHGQVWGAPAVLSDWRDVLGAEAALATRAPGPARSRDWPADVARVDREGLMTLRLPATPPAAAASRAEHRPIRAVAWRRGRGRWWDGPRSWAEPERPGQGAAPSG